MLGQWQNFIIVGAEAAATLAGLVIVAISVNIEKIISYPHLPARAAATVGTLVLVLVVSMAALIPQELFLFGVEIIVFGICCWFLQIWAARQILIVRRERKRPWHESVRGILFGQIQTLPFIIGGIILSMKDLTGFYWIAGGIIAIFILSMYNAWVLLVEILR